MGFESVYRCLKQVFPQIDNRILKAVALEYPKDADAAVNDVLTEVLPFLAGPSNSFEAEHEKSDSLVPPHPVASIAEPSSSPRSAVDESSVDKARPSSDLKYTAIGNSLNDSSTNGSLHADLPGLDKAVDELVNESKVSNLTNGSDSQLTAKNMDGDVIDGIASYEQVDPYSLDKKDAFDERLTEPDSTANGCVVSNGECYEEVDPCSVDKKDAFDERLTEPDSTANGCVVSNGKCFEVDECIDFTSLEPSSFVAVQTADAAERDLQPDLRSDLLVTEGIDSSNLASKSDYSVIEKGSNDDAFASNGEFTQSGQICSTDFLDEIIEDSKNNKKTLFSVMESVMNMMKEVELEETAAELAKEEASMGGLDILVKVEDLKQMLAHAQETNSMHAGEVYGEKAILATEARELQSRLLCLSDERDKSLATLDEMRQTLEARLAAAQELKKEAEKDKLRKEESARKALAEQVAIMEKVVQESKLLELEAAENSKLQEFLVDRGRIVDTLQGEISVICQDVLLLKEKFDNRVPLNMSVSSSQTTCKLASSGSSLKSLASVLEPEEPELCKSPEEGSSVSSTGGVTPKHYADENLVKSNEKEIEDGWDIFDKDEELLT